MKHMNERFEMLCLKHGMNVKILNIENPERPKYVTELSEGQYTITLNDSMIDRNDYGKMLGYIIGEILLPKLQLTTDRLLIRRFVKSDAEACFSFLSDERGMYLDGSKAFSRINEEFWARIQLFEQRTGQYVIVHRELNEVVGTINVFPDDSRAVESMEIGYAISPAHQRKGYAYEAISGIVHFLQDELNLDMVVAGVLPENIPSIRLLEKLDFVAEGLHHKKLWHEALNKPVDLLYYYKDREG